MNLCDIRNKGCDKCSRSYQSKSVCQMPEDRAKFSEKVLMVLSDTPSITDAQNDTVLKGYKDHLFWDIVVDNLKIDRADIYPSYVVKCRDTAGSAADPDEVEACSEYWKEEVMFLKPACILVLGKFAIQSLQLEPEQTNPYNSAAIDYVVEYKGKKHKTKLVVTHSPYFVENNTNLLTPFAKAIAMAYNIALDIETEVTYSPTKIITSVDEVKDLINYIHTTKDCCFDYETTELTSKGVYDRGFYATMLATSFQIGSGYAIPLWHKDSPFSDEQCKTILGLFSKHVWSNPNIRKIGQNIKFDMAVSRVYGFGEFRGMIEDTMLMHHLLWEYERHGLKEFMPKLYPNYEGFEEQVKRYGYENSPLDLLAKYACTDTDLTFRACITFKEQILKNPQLYNVYRNLSMFILKPLLDAEADGMPVSRSRLVGYEKKALGFIEAQDKVLRNYPEVKRFEIHHKKLMRDKAIEKLNKDIDTLKTEKSKEARRQKIEDLRTGVAEIEYQGLNMGAPAQIGLLLYEPEGFGFPKFWDRRKKKFTTTTAVEALKEIGEDKPFIKDLMIHRALEKNVNTYLTGMLNVLDDKDHAHTTFLISGTRTGRLSSQAPNLQNLPKHVKVESKEVEEVVGMVMKSFVATPGHALLQLDFSQAELRIIAELAGEENMINAYNAGEDLHAVTVAAITHITLEEFKLLPDKEKKKLRSKAKAANFGLIYGQQPQGFVEYAKKSYGVVLTLEEATQMRDAFFEKYPKLLRYHEKYIARGYKYGNVRTMFGRTRQLPDLKSDQGHLVLEDERVAINSPVQGTCGEHTLFALGLLRYRLAGIAHIRNTVHDSIVALVPKKYVKYAAEVMKHTAENLPTKMYFGAQMEKLKLAADLEVSLTSWGETLEYTEEEWAVWKNMSPKEFHEVYLERKKK